MSKQTRRTFLKASGGLLGGIAVGTTVTAGTSTDRFIVDAKRAGAADATATGLDVVHDLSAIDTLVVRGSESDVQSLDAKYAPDTAYSLDLPVETETPVTTDEATDEPAYGLQWDKQVQNVPEAHEHTRGEGTRVAVIDTGVAAGHPDLQHAVNEDLSRDFTGDGHGAGGPYGGYHGTHVAGIVASNDRNDAGVVGTAPGTEVVDCRVFSPDRLASFADILAAIVYSASIGVDVANMSIGAYPVSREAIGQFYGMTLNRATTYANANGTLLVASAGNDAADLQHDGRVCVENEDGETECFSAVSLPNEAANVMSISATGPVGYRWGDDGLVEGFDSPSYYTNYGTNAINVAAPGGDVDPEAANAGVPGWQYDLVLNAIAEPQYDGDTYLGANYSYGWVAGTSMACPQVVGAAALVKSQNPNHNPGQVRSTLERTAETVEEYDKTYYGAGFLNPLAAVKR